MNPNQPQPSSRRRAAILALLLIAPVPLLGTTLAMVWFPDATWAKVGFGLAKVGLMLAPIVWLLKVEKIKPRIPRWKNFPWGDGMLAAHATGILIFIIIAATYHFIGESWIDTTLMREKITQMGLANKWLYLAAALYWCTANSLLEEYFWRWFIFARLREVLSGPAPGRPTKSTPEEAPGRPLETRPESGETPRVFTGANLIAVLVCGLLFTAHHVVALRVYFDWKTTALASAGVCIGGATWSLLYLKSKNIYAGYVSHVYADLIIFYLGWRLIFG